MRTIELTEHQPSQTFLTRNEAEQLLTTGLVSLTLLSGNGMYELRAGSQVGTAMLPSLRLLIQPKAGLENLFFLLGFGSRLTRWTEAQFPYEREPDLFKAVAWAFEAEVQRAISQGLVRGYQARSESLSTLRGRIDVASQLRIHQGRPFPLECRFEEYTEDVELNRVIKAAHRRLLQIPGLDVTLARKLRHRYLTFDSVASVEYLPGSVPDLCFTRLNRHWEVAGRLAQLVLSQQSLRDRAGGIKGTTFNVDMNKLFERFVEEIVREEAQRAGYQLVPQAPRYLTKKIPIRPDLVLRRGGQDLAVADVKYKGIELEKWSHADLYQLLAYCVSLGLPAGLLIYASARPLEKHTVQRAGVDLELVGIKMSGKPRDLEGQVRDAARRLLEQAADLRSHRLAASSVEAG